MSAKKPDCWSSLEGAIAGYPKVKTALRRAVEGAWRVADGCCQ